MRPSCPAGKLERFSSGARSQVDRDVLAGDPLTAALIDRHLDFHYEYCRRGLIAGQGEIEVLHIGADCGNQNSALFPPAFFRRFFAPRLKRFVDLAHEHGAGEHPGRL